MGKSLRIRDKVFSISSFFRPKKLDRMTMMIALERVPWKSDLSWSGHPFPSQYPLGKKCTPAAKAA